MHTMKYLTISLVSLLLVSCIDIKPQVLGDLKLNSRCRVKCYNLNNLKTIDKKECAGEWKKFSKYNPELFELYHSDKKINGFKDFLVPKEHPVNLDVRACDHSFLFLKHDVAKDIMPWAKKERDSKK